MTCPHQRTAWTTETAGDNQKGRGQTPKLEFGPSRLEVVKEEEATKKNAAKKKPEEKASSSSSSSRGPAAMDTPLDEREDTAPNSLGSPQ